MRTEHFTASGAIGPHSAKPDPVRLVAPKKRGTETPGLLPMASRFLSRTSQRKIKGKWMLLPICSRWA